MEILLIGIVIGSLVYWILNRPNKKMIHDSLYAYRFHVQERKRIIKESGFLRGLIG